MSSSPDIQPYTLSPYNVGAYVANGRIVYPGPQRTKVAIWGFGCQSRHDVPFDRADFVIWSINNAWNASRDSQGRLRADTWWEMHNIAPDADGKYAGRPIQNENDMTWIRSCPVPLFTVEPFDTNPLAVVWPLDYYARKFRDYFTCTFAYQIATAIDWGFEEIHLFGLQLLLGTKREATVESSCVNYWLGLAEGKGVKVVVPPDDQFLLGHGGLHYGADYWSEASFVLDYIRRWDTMREAV